MLSDGKYKKGPKHGMTGYNALSGDKNSEEKWVQKPKSKNLTDSEKALVMGSCLEVAVVTIFTKHCYKFCEDIYLQQGGGPTGLSSTGSSADVRVTAWARELLRILTDNNVNLEMLFAYVDDIRLVLKALIEGLMFCGKCKTLYHNVDQEKRDLESGETDTQRTSRVLKDIFNSIESDLRFTVESEDDFDDKMLPTLPTDSAPSTHELHHDGTHLAHAPTVSGRDLDL